MAQTLGCLVASMTAGAVILQWGQPTSARPAPAPGVELIAVTTPIQGNWRSIRIDPAGADGRIDRQTHFFVDCEGRWSATESWRSQKEAGENGVIRILLQPSPNTNRVATAQWETTQQLRSLLCRECRIDPRRGVSVHDTLAPPERRAPASVRKAGG